jgi:hypothetical protein
MGFRLWVHFIHPFVNNIFSFNRPNTSVRTLALGLTQPLREMSTRNLPGPARKADNFTAICESSVSQPYGPSRPVTGIILPFFLFRKEHVRVCP